MRQALQLGTTFSHRVLRDRGQDWQKAFQELLLLKFDRIRLGVYWDESEPKEGSFQFSELEWMLSLCDRHGQKVVLTVGVKSPRWPEFYFPDWVDQEQYEEPLLRYVHASVTVLRKHPCIVAWQLENEPLDTSGPDKRKIPLSLLKKEAALLRSLDVRPLWGNIWGNTLYSRGILPKMAKVVDVVGLDLYPKVFAFSTFFGAFYAWPQDPPFLLRNQISRCHKPVWIVELQAEPWEKNDAAYWSQTPKSLSVSQMRKNLLWAASLRPEGIMFWGYEYWWQKKEQGDSRWWDWIDKLMRARATAKGCSCTSR